MKGITTNALKDELIGPIGSPEREQYELELKLEILGDLIRKIRHDRNLTQAELGKILGVQKAQICKIENNTTNVSVGTLLSVLKALNAQAHLRVQLLDNDATIAV